MRQLVLLLALFSFSAAYSQKTYCYKRTKWFDSKGIPHSGADKAGRYEYRYYSFMGNVCYESDKNGYSKDGIAYKFRGKKNGCNWYKWITQLPGGGEWIAPESLLVTDDYSIINRILDFGDGTPTIYVFERSSPPNDFPQIRR